MNSIPSTTQFHGNWSDIIGDEELNTPPAMRQAVKNFFMTNGADTPEKLIGFLLIASFPTDGGGFNRNGFDRIMRKYAGYLEQPDVVFQIRRALYYIVSICNNLFQLQLLFDFDEFVEFLDGLPAEESETGTEGGNKKKRSTKRKSSKKRSTRSKK